jgi:hypothetical protein
MPNAALSPSHPTSQSADTPPTHILSSQLPALFPFPFPALDPSGVSLLPNGCWGPVCRPSSRPHYRLHFQTRSHWTYSLPSFPPSHASAAPSDTSRRYRSTRSAATPIPPSSDLRWQLEPIQLHIALLRAHRRLSIPVLRTVTMRKLPGESMKVRCATIAPVCDIEHTTIRIQSISVEE